jgi:hypothetical protein
LRAKGERHDTERGHVEAALLDLAGQVRMARVRPLLDRDDGDDLARDLVAYGSPQRELTRRARQAATQRVRLAREDDEVERPPDVEVARLGLVASRGPAWTPSPARVSMPSQPRYIAEIRSPSGDSKHEPHPPSGGREGCWSAQPQAN